MIALAALLALTAPPPVWDYVGVSASGLRIFVDHGSVRDADGVRRATVRLGSPHAIVGQVVVVTEQDEFDCGGRRWRMTGFQAFDAGGAVIKSGAPGGGLLPMEGGSMGAAIGDAVCANPKAPTPDRPGAR